MEKFHNTDTVVANLSFVRQFFHDEIVYSLFFLSFFDRHIHCLFTPGKHNHILFGTSALRQVKQKINL